MGVSWGGRRPHPAQPPAPAQDGGLDLDLSGRTAFVSGSSQGIGRATAAGLARAGATTVVNRRDAARLERVLGELRAEQPGADLRAVAADVATAEGAQSVLEAVPQVDVLVNNPGSSGREIGRAHV